MAFRYWPAVLKWAPDCFSVFFPDLDACVPHGDTTEEAARPAEQALAVHLRGVIEDSRAIPEPDLPGAPGTQPRGRGVCLYSHACRAARPRSAGIITVEGALLSEAGANAQQQGKNRSVIVADAARAALQVWRA